MKKVLIISGILFLLLLTFLFWPRRAKLSPDADLQIVRTTVAANENAFDLLTQATNVAEFPATFSESLGRLMTSKPWESNEVAEVLSEYNEALVLVEKALELPRLQVPEIRTFLDDYPSLGSWKGLATLASLKCKALFHSGNEKAAFDYAMKIVRFGHMIEDCEGTLMHYMVGTAVKRIGFRVLQEMTATTGLPCDMLKNYSQQLSSFSANQTALTNVIKREYQFQLSAIRSMRAGNFLGNPSSKMQRLALSILSGPLLSEEKTQKLFANVAREQLKAIPLTAKAMPTNLIPALSPSMTSRLLSGNVMGDILARMTLPAQEKFLVRKCRENVDHAATQIIFALRCHKMKTGVLPSALPELIPAFLPSVPLDDFDGQPMRYSPEKRIIYSIGQDLIDSGGQEKSEKGMPLDIPFTIEF